MHNRFSESIDRIALTAFGLSTECNRVAQKRPFRMATAVTIGVISCAVTLCCQTTNLATDLKFEIVSVKSDGLTYTPAAPGEKVWGRTRPFQYFPQKLSAVQTLRIIIQEAYSVEDWAVLPPPKCGSPCWIDLLAYNIEATMSRNTSKETARLMLRTMLAERFGLEFHLEKRDVPVYALVEGKNGFKLREATGKPALSARMARGEFTGTGTLDAIAAYSRSYADKPVVNVTGIEGVYHIELQWTSEVDGSGSRYDPGFWVALERATGLKPESRKLPRDVIVIDRAQREPSSN